MPKKESYSSKVNTLPTKERIELAKVLIELHAANEILQYDDAISGQIPPSKAAFAHNVFQDAMFHQEIIRLLALWDLPDANSISVPTATLLINNSEVVAELVQGTFNSHANRNIRQLNPSENPEIQRVIDEISNRHQTEFAKNQATKAEETLNSCIKKLPRFETADWLTGY